MEKLNLILNLIIIAYIVIKEMSNIKRGINTVKEYITVLKTQVIAKTIYNNVQDDEYDKEFTRKCHAVARGEINNSYFNDLDEIVVDENGLSEEDAQSPDFLLATCIAVGKDGYEEVIDFDLRGDSAAPLDFSMFGGTRNQHYDIEIVKALAGERRNTASYYAFEQTAYELRKQGKVFDDYVMVAKITLGQIKAALNNETVIIDDDILNERNNDLLIEPDAIIIDVEEEPTNKEVDFDEMLNEGVEKGYEVYTTINVLRQAAKAVLKHQEDISKRYKEYKTKKEEKNQESFNELDSIITAINDSRYAIKIDEMPKSIDELIGGTI